ncbi:hypothetical protein ALO78_102485 [Pseudomonas amygdali pv. ciccaronei]|nr:hypothetical protein ALO78_102485 [Pseudomonas amygdali pv. ciccaronei]
MAVKRRELLLHRPLPARLGTLYAGGWTDQLQPLRHYAQTSEGERDLCRSGPGDASLVREDSVSVDVFSAIIKPPSRTSSLPRPSARGFNDGPSVGADLSAKTVIQSMNFR